MAYYDYAKSEGMTKVVREMLTKALQLHPLEPSLYILLAQQYLDPNAPARRNSNEKTHRTLFSLENVSPARKALLLGLRFLPADQSLWIEYMKLEIGWVEALRRRWKILGIAQDETDAGKASTMEEDVQAGLPRKENQEDEEADIGQNAFGETGESARKAIMRGDLIQTVLKSAFENQTLGSDLSFQQALLRLFRSYPTALRTPLLLTVYEQISQNPVLSRNTEARRVVLEAELYDRDYQPDEVRLVAPVGWELSEGESIPVITEGEELVLALASVVEKMREVPSGWTKQEVDSWNEEVGFWLLKWAGRVGDNEDLRDFLLANLDELLQDDARPTADLCIADLAFLQELPTATSPADLRERAIRFCRLHPTNPELWIERMEAELQRSAPSSELASLYLQGMEAVGNSEGSSSFWREAMTWFDRQAQNTSKAMPDHWRHALTSAQSRSRAGEGESTLYSDLMEAWIETYLQEETDWADEILEEALSTRWDLPVPAMPAVFDMYAELDSPRTRERLQRIYDKWRHSAQSPLNKVEAALTWCRWLLVSAEAGAKEAYSVQDTVRREIEAIPLEQRGRSKLEIEQSKKAALAALESGWTDLLKEVEEMDDGSESGSDEDEDEDEDEDVQMSD